MSGMSITFRYSFVILWYCSFIVLGSPRANILITMKRTMAMLTPSMVYLKTSQFSPGGGRARGPCGPNAIQYAVHTSCESVWLSYDNGRFMDAEGPLGEDMLEGLKDSKHLKTSKQSRLNVHIPAFLSCNVNSCQSFFIRSLNAIHKSACS